MQSSNRVEYEMGYAADEFGNVLVGPFSGERGDFQSSTVARHCWLVNSRSDDFQVEIQVKEKPPRKLGLFNLPVLQVIFEFSQSTEQQQEKFFHRFHQYFHKGGGLLWIRTRLIALVDKYD